MIGASLHRILSRSILRVPSDHLGRMPLVSLVDIPFWVTFRSDWLRHLKRIHALRKNLRTCEWSSLGMVYPRTGVLAYSYYLFSWADYCGTTSSIIVHPDDCLFAEVFLSYICQIDAMIDNPGANGLLQGNNVNKIKLNLNIASSSNELCARILSLPIPRENKKCIFKTIIDYRRNALCVMRQWGKSHQRTLEKVLEEKKNTACNLLAVWSNLLCASHGIREETAQGVYNMFLHFSFLVQIIDDVADSAIDHRNNVENIFIAIVRQNEPEWLTLKNFIDTGIQYIGWKWIRKNLPGSHQQIEQLYNKYAALLAADPYEPETARSMLKVIETFRGLMEWNL